MAHSESLAVVGLGVLRGDPITWVQHEDDDYLALAESDPLDPGVEDMRLLCLHCLINRHPEAGRGMDLARLHGAAEFREGEWHGIP